MTNNNTELENLVNNGTREFFLEYSDSIFEFIKDNEQSDNFYGSKMLNITNFIDWWTSSENVENNRILKQHNGIIEDSFDKNNPVLYKYLLLKEYFKKYSIPLKEPLVVFTGRGRPNVEQNIRLNTYKSSTTNISVANNFGSYIDCVTLSIGSRVFPLLDNFSSFNENEIVLDKDAELIFIKREGNINYYTYVPKKQPLYITFFDYNNFTNLKILPYADIIYIMKNTENISKSLNNYSLLPIKVNKDIPNQYNIYIKKNRKVSKPKTIIDNGYFYILFGLDDLKIFNSNHLSNSDDVDKLIKGSDLAIIFENGNDTFINKSGQLEEGTQIDDYVKNIVYYG